MVVSQAAVVNYKSVSSSAKSGKSAITGKVLSASDGLLVVQSGDETYTLKVDGNSLKTGDPITFILSEGHDSAQILKSNSHVNKDSALLSIAPQLKELLALLDLSVEKIPNSAIELKTSLLELSDLLKKDSFPVNTLNNIVNKLKSLANVTTEKMPEEIGKLLKSVISEFENIDKLNKTIPQKIETLPPINNRSDIVISAKGNLNETLLHFESFKELKDYVKANNILGDHKLPLGDNDKGYLVHIVPNENNKSSFHIFQNRDLENVIKHVMHGKLNSPILKQVPVDSLAQILKFNNQINIDSLKTIDSMLGNLNQSVKTDLSKKTISIILPQLINLVDTLGKNQAPVVERLIPEMLTSVKNDLTQVSELKEPIVDAAINKIESTLVVALGEEKKKDFLSTLFRLTGFDQEKTISQLLSSTGSDNKTEIISLKHVLMSLLDSAKEEVAKSELPTDVTKAALKETDSRIDPKVILDVEKDSIKKGDSSDIRSKVEQVINKLEALQVLAKKTVTPQGDSQLLTIPVNINNEWSELRVRFNKKKKHADRGKNERLSVQLNIDLSVIGEVSAEMEYYRKKDLSINVILANRPTMDWFKNHRSEILEAISKLDINSVQLNFRYIDENKEESVMKLKRGDRLDISG